jgi:hypothetical protein
MANIFLDLQNGAVGGQTFAVATTNTNGGGSTVDLADCVGNMAVCHLQHGAVAGATTVTVKIQQSTQTNANFADISGASFATFTTTGTAGNGLNILSFRPTMRYVRAYATLNTSTTVTLGATIFGQRRTTPSANGGFSTETGGTSTA